MLVACVTSAALQHPTAWEAVERKAGGDDRVAVLCCSLSS